MNTNLRFGTNLLAVLVLSGCGTPRVVYYTTTFNGTAFQNDIFVVNEDGTGRVPLAVSPNNKYPCGITSDKRIVFTTVLATGAGISIVNADGTNTQPLQTSDQNAVCFGVSRNDRVVFTRSAGAVFGSTRDIFSVKADGSNVLNPQPLAQALADEYPLAITSNNRVVFAKLDSPSLQPGYSIYSIPADGGATTPIMGSLAQRKFEGVTSKGTIVLSYEINHELSTIHDDGTAGTAIAAQLTNPVTSMYFKAPYSGLRKLSVCTISGERLLFDLQGVYQAGDSFTDTYISNADGTGLVMVHHPNRGMQDSCQGLADTMVVIIRTAPIPPYSCSTPCTNLLAVPAGGGAEVPLGTAGHNYRFQWAVYDHVIFRESVGNLNTLYSVKNDGTNLKILEQGSAPQMVRGTTITQLIYEHDTGLTTTKDLNAVIIDGSKPPISLANPGNYGTVFW